jgi:hypothetical protein
MRTLVLTLLVLTAVPSVAWAKKRPGSTPKPHAVKRGATIDDPPRKLLPFGR